MMNTRFVRFSLIAGIAAVSLLIFITLSACEGGSDSSHTVDGDDISHTSDSILQSGDILIHDNERIWQMDPSDYSLDLLVDVTREGFMIAGDVRVSPRHDYIYMTVGEGVGEWEFTASYELLLIQVRLSDGAIEIIPTPPGLARLSTISLDGEWAFLYISPGLEQMDPTLAYQCLLEIETGNCELSDAPVDINDVFWIEDNALISLVFDTIHILSIESDHQVTSRSINIGEAIQVDDLLIGGGDLVRDCCLVLIASTYSTGEDSYEQRLVYVDLDNWEVSEFPFSLTEHGPAPNDVSIRQDLGYVSYERGHRLEVQDIETGEVVATLDGVLYSSWMPDDAQIIAYVELDLASGTYSLMLLDVLTGEVEHIPIPDHQVYIVTVP